MAVVGDELPKMGALIKWPHGGNQTQTHRFSR